MFLDSNGHLTYVSRPTQSVNDPSDRIRFNTVITEAATTTTVDPAAPIQVKSQRTDNNPSISASGVSTAASSDATTATSSAVSELQVVEGGRRGVVRPL